MFGGPSAPVVIVMYYVLMLFGDKLCNVLK